MPVFPKSFRPLAFLWLALMLAACAVPATYIPQSGQPAPAATTAAPATPTPAPSPFTVTDALRRQVAFQQPPQRIVVTGKGLLLVTDAIYLFPEAAPRIVALGKIAQGVLDFVPVIDPQHKNKTILETNASVEAIAALQPDLVLMKSTNGETLAKQLETLGIPTVFVDFETPAQYQRDLLTLGQIFGNPERAEQLAAYFQSRVDKTAQALAGLKDEQKPRVLLLYYTGRDGAKTFSVPPLSWIQTELVTLAGGRPAWKDAVLGSGWTKVGFEQIAAWDADQIVIVAYFDPVDQVVKDLKADPQWQTLRAVKAGKLHAFPGDYFSWDQPDPRWILGLTWLASKVHPDLFAGLDITTESRAFYRDLYRLDDATFDQAVAPNLVGDLH